MRKIEITEDWPFYSYPNGKDERLWNKGDTDKISNEHAKLLVETKGLAKYLDDPDDTASPAAPERNRSASKQQTEALEPPVQEDKNP